jgi:hypothetical protein
MTRAKVTKPRIPVRPKHPIAPVPAASTTPLPLPDLHGRPILVRTAKLRAAYKRIFRTKRKGTTSHTAVMISIPSVILEVLGLEVGATMIIEAYANQTIRLFPAGDVANREDEEL